MTTEPRIAEALTAAHKAYEPHAGFSHDDGMHDAIMAALPHLIAGLAEDEAVVERVAKAICDFEGDREWNDLQEGDLPLERLRAKAIAALRAVFFAALPHLLRAWAEDPENVERVA